MALPLLGLALLPNVVIVAAILAISGFAVGPINPMDQTYLQERLPEELLGRVFGFVQAIAWAAIPLGLLVAGPLIEYVGLRATILVETGTLLSVALGLFLMPSLHELD